jgi:hypothetical protein
MRTVAKWAVVLAAINLCHLQVGHLAGIHSGRISHGMWYFPLAYLFIVLCVWLGVRETGRQATGGYGRRAAAGFAIAGAAALPAALGTYCHYRWIATDFTGHLLAHIRSQPALQSIPPDEFARIEPVLRAVYSPPGLALATPVVYLCVGGVTALIAAAVVRPGKFEPGETTDCGAAGGGQNC